MEITDVYLEENNFTTAISCPIDGSSFIEVFVKRPQAVYDVSFECK